MLRNTVIFIFLLLSFLSVNGQKKQDSISTQETPLAFGNFSFGYTNGSVKGYSFGLNVNYQEKNNLFTFKTLTTVDIQEVNWLLFFPIFVKSSITNEYSLLYGKRYIKGGFSYHFSGGVSYNFTEIINNGVETNDSYIGLPLEIGLRFFKSKKKRFGVLFGLIPVGKPTAFGRSIGLKLYANVSKKSYFGFGLTFGLGFHKVYENEI